MPGLPATTGLSTKHIRDALGVEWMGLRGWIYAILRRRGVPPRTWEEAHAELAALILERKHTRAVLRHGIRSWARYQALEYLRRDGKLYGIRRRQPGDSPEGDAEVAGRRRVLNESDFLVARSRDEDDCRRLDEVFGKRDAADRDLRGHLEHAIGRLRDRDARFIVREVFFQGRTNRSVAKDIGLTESRVGQVLNGISRGPGTVRSGVLVRLREILREDPRLAG